jgi:hypothetical protein
LADLSFPKWFPPHLRSSAHRLHGKASAAKQMSDSKLLERLVNDPRMANVWREFERKKRGTNNFLHPAIPPPGVINKGNVQRHSTLELFCTVFEVIRQRRLLSLSTLSYSQMSKRLRHDAEALKTGPKRKYGLHRKRLEKAAETYATLDAEGMFEEQIRSMVVEIADFMKERFGTVMLKTVSTIASVALGCEITPSDVRNWVRISGDNDKKRT